MKQEINLNVSPLMILGGVVFICWILFMGIDILTTKYIYYNYGEDFCNKIDYKYYNYDLQLCYNDLKDTYKISYGDLKLYYEVYRN